MKKKFQKTSSILLFFIMIAVFNFSYAQDGGENKPSVPCQGLKYELVSYVYPRENSVVNNRQTPLFDLSILNQPCFELGSGNINSYQNYFQFLFDLAIGVCIALAVIIFTVGAAKGLFYSVSTDDIKKGREDMENAVVGLLVVLSVWLIINTINPDLLRLPILQGLDQLNSSATSNKSVGVSGAGA